MNTTKILKKAEVALLWIYELVTNKFTSVFSKLKEKFPVLNRYPLLKYSLIPLFIALFLLIRYILKYAMNELAAKASGIVAETSGYFISERVMVLSIAVVFIMLRIVLRLRSQKKEKNNRNSVEI